MIAIKQKYDTQIRQKLMSELEIHNIMALPKLVKVVVNVGLGEALTNPNAIERAIEDLKIITGQARVIGRAKKAISNFKLREGDKISTFVTLRGDRAWALLDRTINLALPRVKDFRGVSRKSFDKAGNYTLSFKEQTVFPEIDSSKVDKLRGFEITFVIGNSNPAKSLAMLKELGMPFEKEK